METINIHDAKIHFLKLLVRVHSGEEFIILKAGKPYAKLVPLEKQKHRKPGIAKGRVTKAFFEPLPDEELQLWE